MFAALTKNHRRSSLYRDSKWYLAWTKYLRNDFEGALSDFDYIEKKQKTSWQWRSSITVEKVKYWKAMAQMQLGQFQESYETMQKLSKLKSEDYYGTVSSFRLQQVYQMAKDSGHPIETSSGEKRFIANIDEGKITPEAVLPEVPGEDKNNPPKPNASNSEEEDDSDYNENLKVALDEEPSDFYYSLFKDDVEEESEENEFITYFKHPKLSDRFDRVRDLVRIGYNEAARWELYEIELRTRNETYQKSIMGVYKEIGAHNRSAYVSSIYFGTQRKNYGVEGVKYLWEHAYPRPYLEDVKSASNEFQVQEEFIYSIMRAESFFRATIESPVGAKGLMQIMPNTGRQVSQLIGEQDFVVEDLLKPKVNIRLGAKYLQRLLKMFGGQIPLAAAGYNAGPHRVETWLHQFGDMEMDEFIEHIPYLETRNYVKKVSRHFSLYNKLYANNSVASVFLVQPIKPVLNGREPIRREHWNKL
ncbi:MAG: lytic transglycosylase domain-containing protein [Bdellovibrionales bacterium]